MVLFVSTLRHLLSGPFATQRSRSKEFLDLRGKVKEFNEPYGTVKRLFKRKNRLE